MAKSFPGFPQEGIAFLRGLKNNNNREWFQPRKEIFDLRVKAPMEQLVDALNSHFLRFAPHYITDPKKAIYRIYRDTRFSKDKTPYKTHIAASFSRAGMEKHVSAGYYFSVAPEEIEVAAGVYMPGPGELRSIRNHLAAHHEEFRKILRAATLRKLMGELWAQQLSRVPKGFSPNHPAADLIRYKHWTLFDTRLDPALILTPQLLPELVKRFQAMASFVEFLNRPLIGNRATIPPPALPPRNTPPQRKRLHRSKTSVK
ncbi:MAG: hypothetical protein IANPNBLG_01457 [Bryobacteraceae bacterium]|nr:hypothetical protein [Bryobacteraceae bacterium]